MFLFELSELVLWSAPEGWLLCLFGVFRGDEPLKLFSARVWYRFGIFVLKIRWLSSALSKESNEVAYDINRLLVMELRTFTKFIGVVVDGIC